MAKNQLFATKSLKVLLEEMAGEHRLKRILGPVTLTSLGVGAVIGAGIFVATGAAAKEVAGPALMLSIIYFLYGRHHSLLGKELRGEIRTHGVSPGGMIDDKTKE